MSKMLAGLAYYHQYSINRQFTTITTHVELQRDAVGQGSVIGPDGGSQAVRIVIGTGNHLVLRVEGHHHHNWPEDFLFDAAAGVGHTRDDGRRDIVALICKVTQLCGVM